MHERGVGFSGLLRIDDCRQRFVFHLDQVEGLFGDMLIRRRHGGDGFPHIAHFVACEDPAIFDHAAGERFRRILGGHHRLHPWQALGLTGVDANDPCVPVRAAQHLPMQQAGKLDIIAKNRLPGDAHIGIDAGNTFPDNGIFRHS